jgi:hypothetical protein
MNEFLHPNQHCGVQNNNIFGAITAVRETIAHAELTHTHTCILTLDFKEAFDNIAHSYPFEILESYEFSKSFQQRIKRMYSNASSSVQVNGHVSNQLPMNYSILQGCPLSMLPFTMCLNPLLCMTDESLTCTQIWKTARTHPSLLTQMMSR